MLSRRVILSKLILSAPNVCRLFNSQVQHSALHKINTKHTNPMELFREWFDNWMKLHSDESAFRVCCVSTASRDGEVSSRSLLLRRLDEDGFVIMTDNRSHKIKNITENPRASLVFLWQQRILDSILARQVRVYGSVQQLPKEEAEELYNNEPTFAKIRSYICHQGQPVEWGSLKSLHDDYLKKLNANENLPMPSNVVSYKIFPKYLEFYESSGKTIADRLLFIKSDRNWELSRIAA